jgi:hypothetical protein
VGRFSQLSATLKDPYLLHDRPSVQDADLIRVADRAEPVRDHQRRASHHHSLQRHLHQPLVVRVQRRRGLVQQHDFGVADDGTARDQRNPGQSQPATSSPACHHPEKASDCRTHRAMAMRCFCPPDSCVPACPTHVSYPSGSAAMKSAASASTHARCTSSSVASGFPYLTFWRETVRAGRSCQLSGELLSVEQG